MCFVCFICVNDLLFLLFAGLRRCCLTAFDFLLLAGGAKSTRGSESTRSSGRVVQVLYPSARSSHIGNADLEHHHVRRLVADEVPRYVQGSFGRYGLLAELHKDHQFLLSVVKVDEDEDNLPSKSVSEWLNRRTITGPL